MSKRLIIAAWMATVVIAIAFFQALASEPAVVKKEVCLSAFGMQWKTSEDGRSHLLSVAKREAVGELFGELVKSFTRIEDFQLKRDEIEVLGSGMIRIQGNPEFFNGIGFGDLCVRINAYVAEEDRMRFRPREVRKKVCFGDRNLTADSVKKQAERMARIQAVTDAEPKLEKLSDDVVLSLLHESKVEEGGFLPGSSTYCATVSGKVVPVEMAVGLTKFSAPVEKDSRSLSDQIVEAEGNVFELKGCRVSGGRLVCDLLVTNRGVEDRKILIYGSGKIGFDEDRAVVVDEGGTRYNMTEIRLADKSATGTSFLEVTQVVPRDARMAGTLVFAPVPSSMKKIALLKFFVGSETLGDRSEVLFRTIDTER